EDRRLVKHPLKYRQLNGRVKQVLRGNEGWRVDHALVCSTCYQGEVSERGLRDPTIEGVLAMRFMMLMIPKGYEQAAPGTMPDADAVGAMMKYNESLQKAGVLLALDGLHPPSEGARVSFEGGQPRVIDGPFPEAKEVVGGYWIIQVRSREEAIEWAKRCPASENEVIEVRQIQEFD